MKNKLLGILVLALFLFACKKEEVVFEATPNIEFISITPNSVTEFEDLVSIVIKYRDGDGDLGENDPDVKNLYVTDSRNDVQYSYRIQQLAPLNTNIKIEGELEIDLKTLSVVGTNDSESATFDIYIIDRAGNKSNTISTTSITVSR